MLRNPQFISSVVVIGALALGGSAIASTTIGFAPVGSGLGIQPPPTPNITASLNQSGQSLSVLIQNNGPVTSSIARVFLDSNAFVTRLSGINRSSSVAFSSLADKLNENLRSSPLPESEFGLIADNPSLTFGVNSGEALSFTVDLATGVSLTDLQAAFTNGSFRIGLDVVAINGDGRTSFISTAPVVLIPLPTTGLLALAGFGAATGLVRPRRA